MTDDDRNAGQTGFGKCQRARWQILAMAAAIVLAAEATPAARGETNAAPQETELAAQEKADCIRNLKTIYEAIKAYETDHKDIPNWLSDLVPQYLSDANVLTCPACRRTGKIEDPNLADPKISSSYLYEFCPLTVVTGNTDGLAHTRREWKRRQMGLLGSVVPIVRCRHHGRVLNLAFDGQIYESGSAWEYNFTNRISAAELTPVRIFAGDVPPTPPNAAHFPPRDPGAGPGLLDLSQFYNVALGESWLGRTNGNLASLPKGVQTFDGVEFDVRGIVLARSHKLNDKRFPALVKGIGVHQKCRHLHFLQAVCLATAAEAGNQVAAYVVHFAGNQARLEIPIVYEHDVRNWRVLADEPPAPRELTVAWTGKKPGPKAWGGPPRLFETTWTNLAPELEIESIDFVSSMAGPAPFLVAISAD